MIHISVLILNGYSVELQINIFSFFIMEHCFQLYIKPVGHALVHLVYQACHTMLVAFIRQHGAFDLRKSHRRLVEIVHHLHYLGLRIIAYQPYTAHFKRIVDVLDIFVPPLRLIDDVLFVLLLVTYASHLRCDVSPDKQYSRQTVLTVEYRCQHVLVIFHLFRYYAEHVVGVCHASVSLHNQRGMET